MKILVIAVHPDDETLGAGGTLLKYRQKGAEIFWAIITQTYNEEQKPIQKETIGKVKHLYGFTETFLMQKTATTLSTKDIPEIIQWIEKIVLEIKPEVVIVPCQTDIHSDHRIVAQACLALLKPHRYGFIQKLLAMEVLSETDIGTLSTGQSMQFSYFEDITDFLEKKLSILNEYKTEIGDFPFPRSTTAIEALAKLRGAAIGKHYAEAFIPLKIIN